MKVAAYLFFIIGCGLVVLILIKDNEKTERMRRESEKNYYIEISGIVSSIRQNRGTTFLSLKKDPNKNYYFGVTRNNSLKPYYLDDFLQAGDSIYKAANSNELFVFKKGKRFRFIIDKIIDE